VDQTLLAISKSTFQPGMDKIIVNRYALYTTLGKFYVVDAAPTKNKGPTEVMITTVVFDLDDTLYDELDYCRSGFAVVAEMASNLPKAPSAGQIFGTLWKHFAGGNRKTTFNAALEELGIAYNDKTIQQFLRAYRNHAPQITLPPDSGDVLEELSAKYVLALLTDGFLPAQRLKVRALRIEKYFRCISYTEQLGREFWKPSPVGFEKLLANLNVKPESAAYVADNVEKDFIAPNKLGFVTIQIIRPAGIHTSTSPQPGAAAKYVIDGISRLPALLDELARRRAGDG
jgi:putative hydrolase of the HAD superfamily